ncbi:MAG: selenium-dependent molybdenum cofactor biosynthesis protein YqeB [Eubacteriales bacterium]|nr:selenium-dependent molybdenum cofactor biosynthesis protein YqeB [Eubacteriales bacterium]
MLSALLKGSLKEKYPEFCERPLVIVRGAGDLASGTIEALHRCGFAVLALEVDRPSAIRRAVAFSEAVYHGETKLEGIRARLGKDRESIDSILASGDVAIAIDPRGEWIETYKPLILIDAILAKRNLGTWASMAPITVALGPGFEAPQDADVVIETQRGHRLGRLIREGSAIPNTGVPGLIAGHGRERVIYAPVAGRFRACHAIGDLVEAEELVAEILDPEDGRVIGECRSAIAGVLRGILPDGFPCSAGLKSADVDPRLEEQENCFTISDKSRALGHACLRAVFEELQRLA